MAMQESGEMYLETIYILSKNSSKVRSIDVADYMGYSKPSISRGVGLLKKNGFVTTDKNGYLFLTDAGREIAVKIYERHVVVSDFLVKIGVNAEVAAQDACKIEHVVSDESFSALKLYIKEHF